MRVTMTEQSHAHRAREPAFLKWIVTRACRVMAAVRIKPESTMPHINRDPLGSPHANIALANDAISQNAIWYHLQLYRHDNDSESFASVYALCPFRPNIGETVIAEDGTVCTVTNVTFRLQRYANGYELTSLVLAVAGSLPTPR